MAGQADILIRPATSTPALRRIDNLFIDRIPDGQPIATTPAYRADIDTVCLTATVGEAFAGGLAANGPRPRFGSLQRFTIDATTARVRVIVDVAVAEQFVGRGVGGALVDEAERRFTASGVALVLTFVDDNSVGVVSFWEHLGYTVAGHVTKGTSAAKILPREAGLFADPMVGNSRNGTFLFKHLGRTASPQ